VVFPVIVALTMGISFTFIIGLIPVDGLVKSYAPSIHIISPGEKLPGMLISI
jgi:hypothetical protein